MWTMTPSAMDAQIVKGTIGARETHREVLRGLGLRRIRHEVVREDTPAVRGMIAKIPYLVELVEDAK